MSYTNRKFTWDFNSLKRYNRLYSAIYDVSANNSGATFASLGALLSDENLDTLIPTSVRKGGMSIKFVRTSDNKYVQYRLMADSWSINTNDWSFCGDDVLVENPEWIYVLLDANDRILAGLKSDGSIEWSIGVPTPVKTYIANAIAEIKNGTEGTGLDGLNKIIAFLSEFSTSDTLKDLLDTKVDKEEGKSLIDSEYAENVHFVENSEFSEVHTDAKDKIMYGVKQDGDFYFGAGIPSQIKNKFTEVESNVENKVDKVEGKELSTNDYTNEDKEIVETQELEENPEYVQVTTDNNNKILEGITEEGKKRVNIPIDTPSAIIEHIDSPEWLEVTTDKNNKVVFGIKKDGDFTFGKFPRQIKKEIDTTIKPYTKGTFNSKLYFNNYKWSPLVKANEPRPLVYKIDKWMNRAIIFPDGSIIYGDSSGSRIKKISSNGEEITLLELEGAIGAFRGMSVDSNFNLYASPSLGNTEYASIAGLYRLEYGGREFTKVLSLYDPNSDIPSERTPNKFECRSFTEDRYGNLYTGIYGQPFCPYIYKSTDGGLTWNFLKDMSQYAAGGIHIHFIEYNKYDDALYCTVGEINKLLKSTDGGNNWVDCNITLDPMKSVGCCIVEDGILLGSDYSYWGMTYKVYGDNSYRITGKYWANIIASIVESDVTGWLYAFGYIDASLADTNWYPPAEAINDPEALQAWKESNPVFLDQWQAYYDSMIGLYPNDAIRPQHTAILISKDRGESWEILCRLPYQLNRNPGIMKNGELAVAISSSAEGTGTIIISEGRHKFGSEGVDVSGDIFSKCIEENETIELM